jgi:starvation-inducible DNA-binding protein
MTTAQQLTQVFNDNFVAYFRSHVAHVNIVGRNFRSDHKLLAGVYERRQEQIDSIAELLRSVGAFMPTSLTEVIANSNIADMDCEGSADELLSDVRADLQQLKGSYEELMSVADTEGHLEISNYAQDQILDIAKSIWMLDSTLS